MPPSSKKASSKKPAGRGSRGQGKKNTITETGPSRALVEVPEESTEEVPEESTEEVPEENETFEQAPAATTPDEEEVIPGWEANADPELDTFGGPRNIADGGCWPETLVFLKVFKNEEAAAEALNAETELIKPIFRQDQRTEEFLGKPGAPALALPTCPTLA